MSMRRLLPYTSAAAVIAILYIAWFFWNRWQQDKSYRQAVDYKNAAPDRQTACDLMAAAFGNSLHDRPTWQAGPGVICQFAGEIRVEKAGVVSRVPRAVP